MAFSIACSAVVVSCTNKNDAPMPNAADQKQSFGTPGTIEYPGGGDPIDPGDETTILTLVPYQSFVNSEIGHIIVTPENYQFKGNQAQDGFQSAFLFQMTGGPVCEVYRFQNPEQAVPFKAKKKCTQLWNGGLNPGCYGAGSDCSQEMNDDGTQTPLICCGD